MNGDQQRQHKAVRDELTQLMGVVEAFEQRETQSTDNLTEHLRQTDARHTEELSRVNRRLVDLQMNLDAAVVEACNTDSAFQAFKQRGFWGRVNWLVTGR